jgi:hypothetical protein
MPDQPSSRPVLTPQQRAARVTAAFYQRKSIHLRDVMRLAGLTRRGALDMLNNLSEYGGIPITPVSGGRWILVDREWLASTEMTPPSFDIHPNTRALVAFALAQGSPMSAGELAELAGLLVPETVWLLEQLRTGGLPIDEVGEDTWAVCAAASGDDG